MKLEEFDYNLPKELIAQYPVQRRDESQMMVLDRKKRSIEHKEFSDFINYLEKGDCLVLNNTKVINARLIGKSQTGGKAEVFILERLSENKYKVLLKPSSRLRDKKICFNNDTQAKVLKTGNPESIVEFDDEVDLNRLGKVPLPPYIRREPEELDSTRYQTVYAENEGATASPTAGLHFTKEILEEIKKNGVEIAYVTLHVSYGTFAPVLEENIENHQMYREYFELPEETIEKIRKTKSDGKRIIVVGTTTTRVLESNADKLTTYNVQLKTVKGWTALFIYPGYEFKIADSLLTNFHSTLLMLVSAFADRDFMLKAYEGAIKAKYRFFSYGDCMLIT